MNAEPAHAPITDERVDNDALRAWAEEVYAQLLKLFQDAERERIGHSVE
jgi:hypothetical protein